MTDTAQTNEPSSDRQIEEMLFQDLVRAIQAMSKHLDERRKFYATLGVDLIAKHDGRS